MFNLCAIIFMYLSLTKGDIIESHHQIVHEPVLTKIGTVTHDVPSAAVSHQSFTQIHSKSVETPILRPGIKTTIHHTSPTLVSHDVETVEHLEPVVKNVKINLPSPAVSHQSITQVHHKTVETPILKPGIKTTIHHTSPTLVHQNVETVEHVEPVVKNVEINVPLPGVSRQSFTQIHHKTVETPSITTTIHHTSPTLVQHNVETVEHAEPVTKNVEPVSMKIVGPTVKSVPLEQTYSSTTTNGVVHSIPLFKTIIPSSSYTYIQH